MPASKAFEEGCELRKEHFEARQRLLTELWITVWHCLFPPNLKQCIRHAGHNAQGDFAACWRPAWRIHCFRLAMTSMRAIIFFSLYLI
jgi:hypothetical protein